MVDVEACEAELAAVMRSDLLSAGAETDEELVEAVIASAQSLFPAVRFEVVTERDPLRPRAVLIRMRPRPAA